MACDSQLTGGFVSSTPLKVVVGRKFMVGLCGSYAAGYQGALFLAEEIQYRPDTHADDDCEFMITNGKKIWLADTHLRMAPIAERFWAVGSGGIAAMVAMNLGCSAEDAVREAIKVDELTSGKVRVFSLG